MKIMAGHLIDIKKIENMTIWIILIGTMLLSWLVSYQLKSRFRKYSKIPLANGMTGQGCG